MALVYLLPSLLHEEGLSSIPFYITGAVKQCDVFFVENERTARRYLKQLWKAYLPGEDIIIDNYEWFVVTDKEIPAEQFKQKIKENKTIGILSEAGCPGVADPGQALIAIAQELNATINPLVGPSSILLALMGSGMNGQQFQFAGYLPIDNHQRIKTIKELEAESKRKNCTQIFIETPYRNNQLLDALLKTCAPHTKLCIAAELTSASQFIRTKTIAAWQNEKPELHKKTAIFLLHSH
jgi:16S rRNA (cytidine1402-2'-O)-methyltransferase